MSTFNYREFLASLRTYSPIRMIKTQQSFSLDALKQLLALLNHPEHSLCYVHIVGTNGKGSTTEFLANILLQSGIKCGSFTSPFIDDQKEMIRVNNSIILESDFSEILIEISKAVKKMQQQHLALPSQFEVLLACALIYFQREECQLVLLEAGLGGRLDATNTIPSSLITIFTQIDLDHTAFLGDNLTLITQEKAAVIKAGSDVISYPQQPEVLDILKQICQQKKAHFTITQSVTKQQIVSLQQQFFTLADIGDFELAIPGHYQAQNATLAIYAALSLRTHFPNINLTHIQQGIKSTIVTGRLSVVYEKPLVIIDGSHNPAGIKATITSLDKYFPNQKITFIYSNLSDKDYSSMLGLLFPKANEIHCYQGQHTRFINADILYHYSKQRFSKTYLHPDLKTCLNHVISHADGDEVICLLGTFLEVQPTVKTINWDNISNNKVK